eukprot:scaffold153_cov201-Chaetoceros_neogracile.AAC.2
MTLKKLFFLVESSGVWGRCDVNRICEFDWCCCWKNWRSADSYANLERARIIAEKKEREREGGGGIIQTIDNK